MVECDECEQFILEKTHCPCSWKQVETWITTLNGVAMRTLAWQYIGKGHGA